MNNFLVEFNNNYYFQETGVVTGENNSVVFRMYIDDVIYISKDQQQAGIVKEKLRKIFKEYKL